MANINEQPLQRPSLPDDEQSILERVMLAQNMVQFYFANLDYRNKHPNDAEISELERDKIFEVHGKEFKEWYESEKGAKDLVYYVQEHTREDIEVQKDMDVLVRSFIAFKNRSSQ